MTQKIPFLKEIIKKTKCEIKAFHYSIFLIFTLQPHLTPLFDFWQDLGIANFA